MSRSIELLESTQAWATVAAKPLDEPVWQAWLAKGRAQDKRTNALGIKTLKWAGIVGLLAAAGFFSRLGAAGPENDRSRYRGFQFGADLSAVARQAGTDLAQVKVIQRRPALIQELAWRPRPLGASSKTDPAQEVVFSFYNSELFRMVVNYDRYETEGLTTEDIVDVISANYGVATQSPALAKSAGAGYGDREEVLAQWQDPQYRFDLIRSSYGPSFKLVGVLKTLEASARAAVLEAARLDEKEAPQREAERAAREDETERAKLEKARLVNKPKFRP